MTADFLFELGTEELPPKALKNLITALQSHVIEGLQAEELSWITVRAFAAPRRLALIVEQLSATTPSRELVVWGPPKAIAFDAEGKPTKAPRPLLTKTASPLKRCKPKATAR